jgi:hypothetical protein
MVLLAVLVEERQVVAAALVGFGAGIMSMAVLLPRLVGPLKLGARGFEAELIAAVHEQAQAHGLSAEETKNVVEAARTETDAWAAWLERLLAESDAGAGRDPSRSRGPILRLAKQYVVDGAGQAGRGLLRDVLGGGPAHRAPPQAATA